MDTDVIIVNQLAVWSEAAINVVQTGDEVKVIKSNYSGIIAGDICTVTSNRPPYQVYIKKDYALWFDWKYVVPHGDLAKRLNFNQKPQEIKIDDRVKLISDTGSEVRRLISEGKLMKGGMYRVTGVGPTYLSIKGIMFALEKNCFEVSNSSPAEKAPEKEEYRFKVGDNVMLSSETSSLPTSEAYWVRQRLASGHLKRGTVYTVARDMDPGSRSIILVQDPKEYNLEAACFVLANYQSSIKTNDNGNKSEQGTANSEDFIQIPRPNIVVGRGEVSITSPIQRRRGKIRIAG